MEATQLTGVSDGLLLMAVGKAVRDRAELVAAMIRLLDAIDYDYRNAPGMTVRDSFETNGMAIAAARAAIAKVRGVQS